MTHRHFFCAANVINLIIYAGCRETSCLSVFTFKSFRFSVPTDTGIVKTACICRVTMGISLYQACSPSKVVVILLIMLFEIVKSNGFLIL